MKKLYFTMILLLLIGAFWLGSWFNQRNAPKTNPTGHSSSSIKEEDLSGEDLSSHPPGTVKITPQKQQLIGVKIGKVGMASETYRFRTLGRIVPDENRIYRLIAATEGLLWEVHGSTTGSRVQKDQLLATYFVNEFFGRQQQYFFALENQERLRQRTSPQPPDPPAGSPFAPPTSPGYRLTRDQVEIARQELLNLGVGEHQMQELTRVRQYATNIEIRSPVAGIILARDLSPRQKFSRGAEFFRIADLSLVWVVADIFEHETPYIRPGMSATVTLPGQGKVFQAKVSEVLPQIDPTTRTQRVRMETNNPDYILRPDMFVDVEFLLALPRAITVPADAVLDSGFKKIVFVDLGNGLFEPREVETGRRLANRIEIIKGLKTGEQIAISGTFLIDSESRLEMAATGMIGALSKDPVCGVEVSVSKAEKLKRKSAYRGKIYYFSSDECKQQFDKNPERYVIKP